MKLGMQVGLGPGHIELDGDPAPLPKGAEFPIFGPYMSWPNSWMNQDATWYGVGLGPGDFVLDGDPALPSQTVGGSPKFSAHFYCGQTAGCVKMLLGMEVGLSPGDFVLDGDPAPSPKGGGAPNFRPMYIAAKRMYGSRCHLVRGLGPVDIVLDGDPAPPPKKGQRPPTAFSVHVYCGRTAGWMKMALSSWS